MAKFFDTGSLEEKKKRYLLNSQLWNPNQAFKRPNGQRLN